MTRVRIPLSNSLAALLVAALAACGGGGGGDAPPAPSATLDISAANAVPSAGDVLTISFDQCQLYANQLLHRTSRDPRPMKREIDPSERRGSGFARPLAVPP